MKWSALEEMDLNVKEGTASALEEEEKWQQQKQQ
jgi:hypothetical protein